MELRFAALEARADAQDVRIAALERQVHAADVALMELLLIVPGLGKWFGVDELTHPAEDEPARRTLMAAISAAVGPGRGWRIRFGLWLAKRTEDPVAGVRVRVMPGPRGSNRYVLEPA